MDEDTEYNFAWCGTDPIDAHILKLPRDYSRAIKRDMDFTLRFAHSLYSEFGSSGFRSASQDKYVDLFTLKERIAGRCKQDGPQAD